MTKIKFDLNKFPLTNKELENAKKRYKELQKTEYRAKHFYYCANDFYIKLNNDVMICFPLKKLKELKNLDLSKTENLINLSDGYVTNDGRGLHFDKLDLHYDIHNLVLNILNSKNTENKNKFYAEIGRKGGSSKSEKKVLASRENGKKGGRPKKA